MDNFKIIYKILKILEKSMDLEEFDLSEISADVVKITEPRWIALMIQLIKSGYIEGVTIQAGIQGDMIISTSRPCITLKGLEYLEDNSFMRKAANLAKGIKDTMPGL